MRRNPTDADASLAAYAAVLHLPCAALGVRLADEALIGLDFLPRTTPAQPPLRPLARRVAEAIDAYLEDPRHRFELPLRPIGTPFRRRVWAAVAAIPAGQTRTYGELAAQLQTSPRAVGQALGDNPLPIVIPCHRVVARAGLGGFDHSGAGFSLEVKRWLLRHEGAAL